MLLMVRLCCSHIAPQHPSDPSSFDLLMTAYTRIQDRLPESWNYTLSSWRRMRERCLSCNIPLLLIPISNLTFSSLRTDVCQSVHPSSLIFKSDVLLTGCTWPKTLIWHKIVSPALWMYICVCVCVWIILQWSLMWVVFNAVLQSCSASC